MAHLPMGWDKMETFPLLVHSATEYAGPFVIVDGKLDRILFDGGYCTVRDSQPKYHFYVRDHLGSIRVVVDEDGKVEQKTYYYPFGGIYGNVSAGTDVQPFKYNGKELDHRHGLDLYDYGARQYDAATGRWTTMDPLAEKYYSVSPYAYCHNNPVNRIDSDGCDDFFDGSGNFLWHTSSGDEIKVVTGENFIANFTDMDFRNRYSALIKIGSYYLSQVDHDFMLWIEPLGENYPSSVGMAFGTNTDNYYLFIDQGGMVNGEYTTASNLVNSFYHEMRHRYDDSAQEGPLGEVNAVLQQTGHSSWNKVTDSFAYSQASYAAAQLNMAIDNNFDIASVIDYVSKLNKAFAGISCFSLKNGKVFVENYLKGVTIYGTQ